LHVVYQPQVHIATRKVVGVEALVRWQHPELGALSPAEFIPVAESSGQIIEVGEWILRTALHQARRWHAQGRAGLVLAVNLSLQQFRHEGLLTSLDCLLEETGFPPGNLELELTESIAMDDPERAVRIVQALHDRGVLLSIDDFGTGYSSLSYLKRLQLNKLKIDKSFIDDIDRDGTDVSIVTAIIGMARSLGMTTIAEGVETAGQLEVLHGLGCDEVQGYFFSRPLSAVELDTYLQEGGTLHQS
jgi:EAL domain-containing protein (putative c-di-GMP-specific phosphodiesterase class I)